MENKTDSNTVQTEVVTILTFCLFSYPGVYALPGLLRSADKVQLFHPSVVCAAGIFEILGRTE